MAFIRIYLLNANKKSAKRFESRLFGKYEPWYDVDTLERVERVERAEGVEGLETVVRYRYF